MRDKQAFEAYVLEKSRAQQQKMQIQRKKFLITGMSLCVCLIALVGFSVIQGQWNNHTEPLPVSTSPAQNGGFVAEEAVNGNGVAPKPTAPRATASKPTETPVASPERTTQASLLPSIPKYTAPSVAPPEATRPLEGTSAPDSKALPYEIEVVIGGDTKWICNATTIGQICDWVDNGDFTEVSIAEGAETEADTYMIRLHYAEKTITCYWYQNEFFRMENGPWLTVSPAYAAELTALLEN